MYFSLKKNSRNKDTLITLRYYISKKEGRFVFSTGLNISSDDWDFENKIARASRGRTDLSGINRKLNKYINFLDKTLLQLDFEDAAINKEVLKEKFLKEFKPDQYNSSKFIYFTDYSLDFINKAPNLVNRNTNKKYTPTLLKHYKKTNKRIQEYEKKIKTRIRIDGFSIKLYDGLIEYLKTDKLYAINTIGEIIRNTKALLGLAKKEGYEVHPAYLDSDFAALKEDSISIALSEDEIEKIFKHDFAYNDKLQNCRDLAIIGLWTGLRVSDFLTLDDIDIKEDFITIQPKKTKFTSGITVVIPLHHHIKEVIAARGMPRMIADVNFNLYFKEVCYKVGLNDKVKGSLMQLDKKTGFFRKKLGVYEKYLIVSSHTCRRSFATNLYKMNIPSLSIMAITGHTTEKSFLKYIKTTPTEHAEKLLDHWKQYYKK
jgi:integrase